MGFNKYEAISQLLSSGNMYFKPNCTILRLIDKAMQIKIGACTHTYLVPVDSSTLSGIREFTETCPNSKFSASSKPPITWSTISAPSCEADHQHLNPASGVAEAAGLGFVCFAGA